MKEFIKIEIPNGYTIDEEKSSFTKIIFKPIEKDWIDLGLPSGNLWCDTNEKEYYNWDDAVEEFGDSLPKMTDFVELYDYCKWEWNKDKEGVTVTGPNGNSIFFPALGYRSCNDDTLSSVGIRGIYWSASINETINERNAYYLYFNYDNYVHVSNLYRVENGNSIRLIKRRK